MKKYSSQLIVAIVCCILGFMLAYQYRILNKKAVVPNVNESNTDITVEIEQYKKQKDEMQKNIDEMQKKLKAYEESAANSSDQAKNLLDEVNNSRILVGAEAVKGPGIVIYLDPTNKILQNGASEDLISNNDLINLINELVSAGAEAISINDIRVTPRTGIRTSGSDLRINEAKISPLQRITIQAIGDKKNLFSAMSFPGVFDEVKLKCKYEYKSVDNITISKSNYSANYKFQYAKPVK